MTATPDMIDLFVIGGGINGAGVARDAAGRGLKVVLCEKDDLAQGTSSRSGIRSKADIRACAVALPMRRIVATRCKLTRDMR